MTGKFLTLEGTEGTGKSTNLQFIKSRLESVGIELLVTREPGGTPLAEEMRGLLLATREEGFDPLAELLVIFAARAQHLNTVIKPALERGCWVLSDRFTDATFAYQGAGRGLSCDLILQLEKLVQGEVQPDLTFYLDIDVKVGLERARARAELDRFEREELAFFERVRKGYLRRLEGNPQRYYKVDASQSLQKVQESLQLKIDQLIKAI